MRSLRWQAAVVLAAALSAPAAFAEVWQWTDAEGVVRYHGAPDDNYEDAGAVRQQYLRDALDAVLEGAAPATATTPAVGCTIKWKR